MSGPVDTAARPFWVDSSKWPRDTEGQIFLARAFNLIGKARFGGDWEGNEMNACSGRPFGFSSTSLAGLVEEKRRRAADARVSTVLDLIASWCSSGLMHSTVRATAGGDFRPVPPNMWNTERLAPRFHSCQMSLADPFGPGIAGDGFGFLFVEREGLTRLLAGQPFATKETALSDLHLSPYLKVMLHVVRTWEVSPSNQHTKDALVAAMKENWTGPIELTERLANAMATLVREPESQAGRAAKKKK